MSNETILISGLETYVVVSTNYQKWAGFTSEPSLAGELNSFIDSNHLIVSYSDSARALSITPDPGLYQVYVSDYLFSIE